MTPNRPLLAAFDGSEYASWTAERGALIARQLGCPLNIIQVINQGALDELRELLGLAAGEVEQRLVDQTQAYLSACASHLNDTYGITPTLQLSRGMVLAGILDHADAIDAGLLMLGAHGGGLVRSLLLGSTAGRLLRKCRRSMLVVHQQPAGRYRRVLVAIDFSPWSVPAIELAKTIAPDAEMVLFHAFEVPFEGQLRYAGIDADQLAELTFRSRNEAGHRLQQLAQQHPLPGGQACRQLIEHGSAARLIVSAAEDLRCDLIVIGKSGRGQVEEWLLGSSTKHVLAESPSDVAIVHT